jgi:hypothetical protein
MLNGRRYGRDPFSNVQDQQDPEFVEWGYGGMGSVKHGTAGSDRWKAVQASGSFANKGDHSDDDGTGMAWVRKKRLQRERERMEKGKGKEEEGEGRSALADASSSAATSPAEEKHSIVTTSLHPVRSESSGSSISSDSSSEEDEHERKVRRMPFFFLGSFL